MNIEQILDIVLKSWAAVVAALIVAKSLELWGSRYFFAPAPSDAEKVDDWLEKKERGLTFIATTVSSAPFLGLAGTITHIIKALTALGGSAGDIGVISGPIALSLYATLWGLASAIPANIFYNLAQRRLQLLENRVRKNARSAVSGN